jgi:hypothetical protein
VDAEEAKIMASLARLDVKALKLGHTKQVTDVKPL